MPIYLDYNATTPMDPRVLEAMIPWFLQPSNAGSRTHVFGQQAKDAVEKSRRQIADLIGAKPEEIIFTSGATESNNLAILGLAALGEAKGRKHILSTLIEHKAVLEPLERLRTQGFEVELLPVTSGGYVEADEVRRRLRADTLLVSIMHANNETGVLQPVEEVAGMLADRDTLFHVDAAQTYGKEVESLKRLQCDLLAISGHKIYGPQGIGALSASRIKLDRRQMNPLLVGGGQERGLRSGTVPVALVVGLGKAAELAANEFKQRRSLAASVKQAFLAEISAIDHAINGDQSRCQMHVVNVRFRGVDSEALMLELRDVVAMSNGSACTSNAYAPSHVLRAMRLDEDEINSSVRVSWGPAVEQTPADRLVDAVRSLRI